ncbi:MAG: 1-deoxy-D-xylulose-5-phosphate reductoisomerase [Rickettsiales bacterium]|nr:1-deoxy-D-xylulose-5-phosphate reductoisomerase [Rickettsiales bacterium]|tara:strand:- start:1375 stop:2538 length:1164 start_codon:yes stop_codon:yes gene_type:complete
MKKIALFGATGSVGTSTLDIVRAYPEQFKISVLTAHSKTDDLAKLALEFQPDYVVISNEGCLEELRSHLSDFRGAILAGSDGLDEAACFDGYDLMVTGIVGFAGLKSLMKAIETGHDIAFANKECLVCAGPLVMGAVKKHGVKFLPIDSEHNAIFQVLDNKQKESITRLILTASGGPFREKRWADLNAITPQQAVAHPNWSMGAKISVDSATMMNKGLEIIEAHHLFDIPVDKIRAVLHPQSAVHSFVEYDDGSLLAQVGPADMKTPIIFALGYPQRLKTPGKRLDLLSSRHDFSFYPIEKGHFPLFDRAQEALTSGLEATTVLNSANEVSVGAFLNNQIEYQQILDCVDFALDNIANENIETLDNVFEIDYKTRIQVKNYIKHKSS